MNEAILNRNICKLNVNASSDLVCRNFVYETEKSQKLPHRAEIYALHLVTEGEGKLTVDGVVHALTVGMMYVILRGENFSVSSEEEFKYCYIDFKGRRADELIERFGIDPTHRIYEGNDDLIGFWLGALRSAREGNVDLLGEAVLLYSLSRLAREEHHKSDNAISRTVSLTHEHFTEPNLSISAIAAEIGYDAKYLSSLFKKKKGISYTRYLRELRLKRAIFLMEEGLGSVKNVAVLSGFGDALYFSKVFTAHEGISPSEYIKRIAERM